MSAYTERGYRVVSHQGPTVTLQRPATPLNWIWLIGSFFIGIGIGGLIYVALWLLWRVPRIYSVDLSLNDYGQVVELGDSCAVFNRDRLKLTRIRSWIFGSLLALFGILMAVGLVVSPPVGEDQLSTIITIIIVTGAFAAGAVLFLMAAVKATRKLRDPLLASETKDKADAAEVDVKPDDRETRMVGESGENLARPDWFADPTGRHEYRYWDGSSWTANVADSGNTSSDPLDVAPVVGDERLSKGTQRADDITNRLAEIDDEVGSLRDRIKRAFDASTDAPGGNILIASVRESLGQGPPPGLEGTPTFGQVEALEKEKETLQTELAQLRHAADGGGKPHP